jgi:hypothetical protein
LVLPKGSVQSVSTIAEKGTRAALRFASEVPVLKFDRPSILCEPGAAPPLMDAVATHVAKASGALRNRAFTGRPPPDRGLPAGTA